MTAPRTLGLEARIWDAPMCSPRPAYGWRNSAKALRLWNEVRPYGLPRATGTNIPKPDGNIFRMLRRYICLQGKLLHAFEETTKAIDCYAEALRLNPFMWDAFLALCDLGVNVRMPNIFKMTPEMENGLSQATADETQAGIFDDPPTASHPPPTTTQASGPDPFSVSTNRANTEIRPQPLGKALFEKLNGSTSLVTPIGVVGEGFEDMDTPSAPTALMPAPRVRELGLAALESGAEPPQAPMRKIRPAIGLGVDMTTDAPRMKSTAMKSRIRPPGESEDGEALPSAISSLINDRKRTASGKSTMESSIPSAAHLNDPAAPQRRSVRLFNAMTRPQGSTKLSGASSSLSSKEGREIKKVKATGTRPRSQLGMGRVVSGNRRNMDSNDPDGKRSAIRALG